MLLSSIIYVASRTNHFHGEIAQKNNYAETQERFLIARRRMIDDHNNFIIDGKIISIKDNPAIRRFLNVLNLLEDFVTQEMHVLFRPISDQPDLSSHIDRLNRRTNSLKTILETDFLYDHAKQSIHSKYNKEIRELKESLTLFCNTLISSFEKLQKGKEFKNHANLWRFLENLQYNPTPQIYRDFKNNPTEKGIQSLRQISDRLSWSFQTLKDETFLILILDLLNYGDIDNVEIDNCIEDLINAKKIVENYDTSRIEQQLLALPNKSKSTNPLRKIWEDFFKFANKKQLFNAIVSGLEFHLRRSQEKPNDQLERALALRKALYSLGKNIFFCNNQVRLAISNLKSQNLQEEPEVILVLSEIEDLNDMEYYAALIAMESIKSLIGRGFMVMESSEKAIKEQQKAVRELQSLKAKETSKKLILSETKSVKSQKRNPKMASKSAAQEISSPKTTQKKQSNNIPLKVEHSILDSKKVNVNELIVTPEIDVINDQPVNVPEMLVSLGSCESLLKDLKNSLLIEAESWQSSQIENLTFLIEYHFEPNREVKFSSDYIFEQIDLLRRSVEAVLEISTIYSKTNLKDVRILGHNSEKLLYLLIEDHSVPENIRKLLWNLRNVPISLAEANRCVNYPEESFSKRSRFKSSGKELIDFLKKVDRESSSINPNEAVRKQLIDSHEMRMKQGIYFVERLLKAILNPLQEVDGTLPNEFPLVTIAQELLIEDFNELNPNSNVEFGFSETIENTVIAINNREQALLTIDKALVWIAIRCMAPVEGLNLLRSRKEARNIALKNCTLYLRRLKEKLGPDRTNRPMSTILGQCSLVRRIQKELLIAALYHTDSFLEGKHVVEAHDVRFENSPIVLMNLLKTVSKYSKSLPCLNPWLHKAHQVLSYPTPLDVKEHHFSSDKLQMLVKEVQEAAKEMKKTLDDDWIQVTGGQKISSQKRLEQRKKLVEENETLRIYPEIAFSLQILKEGLSLPTNSYL